MDALTENWDLILKGFWETIKLLLVSGALALVIGTLVGVARVSPVAILRRSAATLRDVFRNTPLAGADHPHVLRACPRSASTSASSS